MPGVVTAFPNEGNHASRPAASSGAVLYSCTTHGLVYRSDGTAWTTFLTLSASGMTNPMTTAGDIIVGGASGAPARLAAGATSGHVLTSNGSGVAPSWAAGAGGGTQYLERPSGYGDAVMTDRPVVYLPMQEGSGSILEDASGNGNDTGGKVPTWTASGGPVTNEPAYLTLNGTSHYFQIPRPVPLWHAFSLECWLKTSATAGAIFSTRQGTMWYTNGDYGVSCFIGTGPSGGGGNGKMLMSFDGGGVDQNGYYNTVVNDSTWHHLVMTFSGATGDAATSAKMTMYVDGSSVTVTAGATAGSPGFPVNMQGNFTIGVKGDFATNFLAASIAHFAIYRKVLTSTRVSAHYAARTS